MIIFPSSVVTVLSVTVGLRNTVIYVSLTVSESPSASVIVRLTS